MLINQTENCFPYFPASIYVLMLTFGVITGFGLSLCYVAAVVIVAYYFERRRSFATGLSVCGGGIGTFLFAPLSTHLIGKLTQEICGLHHTPMFILIIPNKLKLSLSSILLHVYKI